MKNTIESTYSYSFYSKNLNKEKYDLFVSKAIAIKKFKNKISNYISKNLLIYLDKTSFDVVEEFKCTVCGHVMNADLNSSINICLLGQQEVLECQLTKIDSLKQWHIPKPYLKKEKIKDAIETIVTSSPFQENRENLFEFIGLL